MKKKILFIILAVMVIPFAFGTPKYYYDYNSGYFGMSSALYWGKDNEVNLEVLLPDLKQLNINSIVPQIFLGEVEKLTKEEGFLLWKALEEYDYKIGEYYLVSIYRGNIFTCIFVKIESSDNISWWSVGQYHKINK